MRYGGRPRRAQARHSDDWLLTYADTVTLLLCLFVVLLATHADRPVPVRDPVPVQDKVPAVPAVPVAPPVVAGDFVDWKPLVSPVKPANESGADDASDEAEDRTAPPRQEAALPPPAAQDAQMAMEQAMAAEPEPSPAPAAGPAQPAPGVAVRQPVSGAAAVPLSGRAADGQTAGPAHLEPAGDRITQLVFDSAAFFNRGAATLNNAGKVILQDVVSTLKSATYQDYMVTIEGHTDDAAINTAQFPSNWELSAARAAAVARFFVEQGVPAQRLRAAGYADTRPLQPNRDGNGMAMPDNQARNRRVVIELEKIEHH